MILNAVNQRLANALPTILVATQLIEAGVDISLGCVVRSAAGLDSIAQAAGRCNRHGEQEVAPVYVVQLAEEKLNKLPDIEIGQKTTLSMFDLHAKHSSNFDPLLPETQRDFFQRYYSAQTAANSNQLLYPTKTNSHLVDWLSRNHKCRNAKQHHPHWLLQQSFMTASKAFQAIDAPTRPVIVCLMHPDPKMPASPTGREIVAELQSCQLPQDYQQWKQLMQQAQRFTINLFEHEFKQLSDAGALFSVNNDEGVFALNDAFIDEKLGWTTQVLSCGEFF